MVTALAMLVLAATGWAAPSKSGPLALDVRPEPAVAVQGAPISIYVRLTNRLPAGERAIRVNRRCLLGREVVITVRAKRKLPLALVVPPDLGPPVDTDFRSLEPGEHFEYEYPLAFKSVDHLPPGSYDIRVTYRNDASGPGAPPAWTGSLKARAAIRVRRMVK